MKRIFIFFFLVVFPFCVNPQSALSFDFSQPESIVHSSLLNKYLVSNAYGANILLYDKEGNLDTFIVNNLSSPKGLMILDDVLYVADNLNLKAFNLTDKSLKFSVQIVNTPFINDIAADSAGNIYLSHTSGDKIYKYNIQTQNIEQLAVKSQILKPNGLMYAQDKNSLYCVSFNHPGAIYTINLDSLTVKTKIFTTRFYFDGIANDNSGNIYVSCWDDIYNPISTGNIFKYEGGNYDSGTEFASNLSGPADIYFDSTENFLFVPVMAGNDVLSYDLNPVTQIKEIDKKMNNLRINPNPSTGIINVISNLSSGNISEISIINTLGMELYKRNINSSQSYNEKIDCTGFPSGMYLFCLKTKTAVIVKTFIIQH
ncbi:MAG: T9SS type A sorting domain-containing protein [Bacteroidota bacterium]